MTHGESPVVGDATWMKAFPRQGSGVLLPVDDRRTAALGVTMYTACKPCGHPGAAGGVHRSSAWSVPGSCRAPRTSRAPVRPRRVGDDGAAVGGRRRADRQRRGLPPTAGTAGGPDHDRDDPGGGPPVSSSSARPAARSPASRRPWPRCGTPGHRTFRAPAPLAHGSHGEWWWSIQEAVFTRPHSPVFDPPAGLFEEIRDIVGGFAGPGEGRRPTATCRRGTCGATIEVRSGSTTGRTPVCCRRRPTGRTSPVSGPRPRRPASAGGSAARGHRPLARA